MLKPRTTRIHDNSINVTSKLKIHLVPRPQYYRPQKKFAKVMFSQVSVCPQGWHVWWGVWHGVCMMGGMLARGACMPGACVAGGMHGRRDSHYCSGCYASYWNAFLFKIFQHVIQETEFRLKTTCDI